MSSSYRKIQYESEGPYGSTEERYLYIKSNNSSDVITVYDDDGDYVFSFSETGFDMGQALVTALTDWQNLKMEIVSQDEWESKINKNKQ